MRSQNHHSQSLTAISTKFSRFNHSPGNTRQKSSFSLPGIIVVLLFVTAISSFAQTAQYTQNKADQTLSSSGRVNPSTLGMEIEIPLGSYPGRGINVPINLSYSSKLWRMKYLSSVPGGIVSGGCRAVNSAEYAENSASGWTTSLSDPYIEYVGKDQLFNDRGFPLGDDGDLCDPNSPPPEYHDNAYVRRLVVHLPSGETHELRASDEGPVVYPPGSNCYSPNSQSCDPNDPRLQSNWNRTYYAADSSNVKYIEDSNSGTYKLQMPDGSFYTFASSISYVREATARAATKYTDRNGNHTDYSTQNANWTDTLGRTLSAPIAPQAPTSPTTAQNPQTFTLPGMTGSYKFQWKKLKSDSAAESALTDFSQILKYRGDKIEMGNNGIWTSRPAGTYLFQSKNKSYVLSGEEVFNPIVLTEIELPTGGKYKFSYDIFGRIERITYPTGGEEKFVYSEIVPLSKSLTTSVADEANFGVTTRQVYPTAGQGTPYEWHYAATYVAPAGYKVSTTNPDQTISERLLHQSNGDCPNCFYGNFGYDNGLAGMSYEELNFSSAGALVTKSLTSWTKTTFPLPTSATAPDWHPRVTESQSFIYDENGNGVSSSVKYDYEGDLSQRETPVIKNKTTEYAFVAINGSGGGNYAPDPEPTPGGDPDPDPTPVPTPTPSSLTPIRISETTYLINDGNLAPSFRDAYKNQNMVGLATASLVRDGAGTIVSRSTLVYDDSNASPNVGRGNATTQFVWDSTKGSVTNAAAYIATHAKFDGYGNQYETTDARGNTTTTTFDSTYHCYPVMTTSAVPNLPGKANGSPTAFQTTAVFNPTTGLPTSTVDANGLETRIAYDPVSLRPLNAKTFYSNNQIGSESETVYHDEPNNYWTKSRAKIDDTHWSESTTYYDGLGRSYKSEQADTGGNVFVEKEFDAQGRVSRVTNPFRANEAKQWTTNVYDEASRVKEVDLPDQSKVLTAYGVSTSGVVGMTKQITDQAGRKRKGIADALGRMIRVIEDPDGQNLPTDYTFDTLGNLHKTVQGEQSRYFSYDSLGRLLYAKQPEQNANASFSGASYADPITANNQWSVKYEYDDSGNITKTTDARNISIAGTYDNSNRLILRDYSDATPDVNFYYDGTGLPSVPAFSKGKTTRVTSAVSENRYTSFDSLGKVLQSQQITDGQTYAFGYGYNLSGALLEETYPSGRVVKNTLDADGALAQVQSRKNASFGYHTYAGGFSYNAAGAVEKMQLGNGRWESAAYNNRQQVTQIGLGATSTDQNLLKLEFGYNTTSNSHDDNGAMLSQKITVPTDGANTGFVNTQTYAYDNLNRLHSAQEKDAGNNQTWKQTFQYDRYGNRRFDAANTTTLGTSPNQNAQNPLINTANNRIDDNQGYIYDANGNLTQDANNLATPNYLYDAESRQKEIKDPNGVSRGIYLYDGEGKRVKKKTDFEETIFVYDGGGQLAAEYSTQTSSTPQTSYLTTDHLGSPRITTDQNGAVKSRKDFSAFGDETKTAQRTSGLHYLPDTVHQPETARQDYTGYQKDEESNLEYAQARYYNPGHGRFTSVDPLMASASIKNPQTFNRYSYVLNSPYKFTDPLGLLPDNGKGGAAWDIHCGLLCRIGTDSLKKSDYALIQFHIANGTALGYNIQNAMQSRMSQQSLGDDSDHTMVPRPRSRVESASTDPVEAEQEKELAKQFTDDDGIVRTGGRGDATAEGGLTHFRITDGRIFTIHIYRSQSGLYHGDVFVPKEFNSITYDKGKKQINATNTKTGMLLVIAHVEVNSQKQLNENLKTTNNSGSRFVGRMNEGGGPPGYIHAHLTLYVNAAGRQSVLSQQYGPDLYVTDKSGWSDFRKLIKH